MAQLPRPCQAVWLAAILSFGAVTSANLPILMLARDTCAANYAKCSQPGLPAYFCCPNGQTCNVLASNTTVLCCPKGADCTTIQPISCDITQQDGQKNPGAVIKTTILNGVMSHCGQGTCCPFGYTCNSNNQCSKDANQNALPFTTTPAATSSSRPTSAVTNSAKPTSTSNPNNAVSSTDTPQGASTSASGAPTPPASENASGNNEPQPAVIAGAAIAAALVGILAAVVSCIWIRRRNARKNEESDNVKSIRSTSSFGNIISNPIVSEGTTMRSDFSRRSPGGRASNASSFATRVNEDLSRIAAETGATRSPPPRPPPPSTPTRPARPYSRESARVPPIRNMRQSSIAYGYGAPNTSPYRNGSNIHAQDPYTGSVYPDENTMPCPQTPKPREPSSMSIPLYADERTLGQAGAGSANYLAPPSRRKSRDTTFTTWTDMLKEVELDGVAKGKETFVPSSPWRRELRR